MQVVGCFLCFQGQILLLKRQDSKPQANTWGIPSGKVEKGETNLDAIHRELREETGLNIAQERFLFQKTFHVFHQESIDYNVFLLELLEKPEVIIDPKSHKDYFWISPQDALKKDDLIQDLDLCIKDIFKLS